MTIARSQFLGLRGVLANPSLVKLQGSHVHQRGIDIMVSDPC
jgi:hypothetical protein